MESVCWDVSRCYRTTHNHKHKPAFTRVCAGFTPKVSKYVFLKLCTFYAGPWLALSQVGCHMMLHMKRGVLPGSAADLRAWSRWASSRTSPRCACTGTCIPVCGSSWWASGCCPPWCHSGRCSPARCGKRTAGGRHTFINHHRFMHLMQKKPQKSHFAFWLIKYKKHFLWW